MPTKIAEVARDAEIGLMVLIAYSLLATTVYFFLGTVRDKFK